jgi:hypothetical protein
MTPMQFKNTKYLNLLWLLFKRKNLLWGLICNQHTYGILIHVYADLLLSSNQDLRLPPKKKESACTSMITLIMNYWLSDQHQDIEPHEGSIYYYP